MTVMSNIYSRKGSFVVAEEKKLDEMFLTEPTRVNYDLVPLAKGFNGRNKFMPARNRVSTLFLALISVISCVFVSTAWNKKGLTSTCYDWLSEESGICDAVSFYMGDAASLNADVMDYSIHVLASEKRARQTKRNLHLLAPYQTTPAVYRSQAGAQPEDTATKADWDWFDRRMRSAYIVQPVQPGEVGCILGHRRLLEDFLQNSDKDIALVLEDDAIPMRRKAIIAQMDQLVEAMDDSYWDFVQLGRCWDINCYSEGTQHPVATLQHGIRVYHSQGFEFCSHAYLVSRKGAERILQYTMPFVLPFDLTVMLLSRNNLLQAFYTSENFFKQDSSLSSLIRDYESKKPVCYPKMTPQAARLKVRRTRNYDLVLLGRVTQSTMQEKMSVETRRLSEASTAKAAEEGRQNHLASLCDSGKERFCRGATKRLFAEEVHRFCEILGGRGESKYKEADDASKKFVDALNAAGLEGVIVWGLRPDTGHTHKHIHAGIYRSAQEALAFSPTPKHLCYVPENPVLDLGRYLYQNKTTTKLAKSLVFASPKHMTWSDDPGFVMLPVEDTSRYIFHGEVPRPHTILKKRGLAVEWETWGPDGWTPDIDSDAWQRSSAWLDEDGCSVDAEKKTKLCPSRRVILQPWAAKSTPSEIEANKIYVAERSRLRKNQTTMHFQGTIWDCNIENFLKFSRGCGNEGLEVVRYGHDLDNEMMMFSTDELREELFDEYNFFMEQSKLSLKDLLIQKGATFAPSFQGQCHFAPNPAESYIADRILNLIAIGVFPMTNNPASFELLGNSSAIVFDTNVTNLCKKATQHAASEGSLQELMDVVKRDHTYISRLSTALQFIEHETSKMLARKNKVASNFVLPTAPLETLDTSSLHVALKECNNQIDCVLSRIPIHPHGKCSHGLQIGSHHRMGSGLASALKSALPCNEFVIVESDHMLPEDYVLGRPVIHFIRDPLETVVSGYQLHISSNESWLVTSGYKEKLLTTTLKNGLEKEFHSQALYQLESALGIYDVMKSNQTSQQDFFTVRIDDVRSTRMFDLTTQAIQVWLGLSPRVSFEKLKECCFRPQHVNSYLEKPSLRQDVMEQHASEIHHFRRKMDFSETGFEEWTTPPPVRLIPSLVLAGTAVLATLAMFAGCIFGAQRSKELFGTKNAINGYGSTPRVLWARFCSEFAWNTPMFAVHDQSVGADIDVQETFAPTFGKSIWKTRFLRISLFVWSLHVLWFDLQAVQFPWFYFAFLSQAGFALNIVHFFISMLVSFAGPLKKNPATKQPTGLVCIYWGCFAAVATCQFIVTVVHWVTNLDFFLHVLPTRQRYPSLMKHGIFFVITLWEGQCYSRIPIRAKHYIFPFLFLMLYAAWTCYQSNYGPSNPFFYGQEHPWSHPDDDDAVYPQLNWRKRPGHASVNVAYGIVFAPVHFGVLWILSNLSYDSKVRRYKWDGQHRRFAKKSLP